MKLVIKSREAERADKSPEDVDHRQAGGPVEGRRLGSSQRTGCLHGRVYHCRAAGRAPAGPGHSSCHRSERTGTVRSWADSQWDRGQIVVTVRDTTPDDRTQDTVRWNS